MFSLGLCMYRYTTGAFETPKILKGYLLDTFFAVQNWVLILKLGKSLR